MIVAALYVRRASSPYRALPVELWDEERDARRYDGPWPVVAHPPCGPWGRLAHRSKASADEWNCGPDAVRKVWRYGGVLEHPAFSGLWDYCGLPLPGQRDKHGGFTLPVLQSWFGHRAPKATWLYIVGREPASLPAIPYALGEPGGRVELMGRAERERTPEPMARWLVEVAEGCARC